MSNVRKMSDEELRREYRSATRQNTRAGLGAFQSSMMASVGLFYMAIPAGMATYGSYQSNKRMEILEAEIRRRGLGHLYRDWFSSRLIGAAEKAVTSALFLGHDEVCYTVDYIGMGNHLEEVSKEVGNHSITEGVNKAVNAPVDGVKDYFGYDLRGPVDVSNEIAIGVAAGAVEVVTNRTGQVGADMRKKARSSRR